MLETVASTAPWWGPYVVPLGCALIGSGVAITEAVRKIYSGFGRAETRNLAAQADKTEAEAKELRHNRSADFERMLNERTFKNMDLLVDQVKHLSAMLEAQSLKMDHMEREIGDLRRALDERTAELRKVRLHLGETSTEEAQLDLNLNFHQA